MPTLEELDAIAAQRDLTPFENGQRRALVRSHAELSPTSDAQQRGVARASKQTRKPIPFTKER
jgi:hypothetical protein